ncbi:MAG: phosphopeptide-binding protein [Bacteroidota bacterium]
MIRTLTVLSFLFALLFTACGGETEGNEMDDPVEMEDDMEVSDAFTITPFPNSTEYPDAKLEGMNYNNGTFEFPISATDYELGAQTPDADSKMCANSAKGQHIHLIIDNEPYIAKYENTFDQEVADGEHHVLAFLSRSYHESLKHDGASIAQKVNIENGSVTSAVNIEEPMLFYSRPKGTYVGAKETEKVMLDFYPVNVELGADYKVKLEINGEEQEMIDAWQPYFIEGLPMGDNRIKLTLVDGEGNSIDTPLNPVERVFTLKEDKGESIGMR